VQQESHEGPHTESCAGSLDTSAELSQPTQEGQDFELDRLVNQFVEISALRRRAHAKITTQELAKYLAGLRSPLRRAYWRSYDCCSQIELTRSGKTRARYCKARWCLVCNRIRTAKYIQAYSDVIAGFTDAQFVTLTAPNCNGDNLASEIDRYIKNFRTCTKQVHNRSRSQNSVRKLRGFRKLEVTYNHATNTYHPHFHVICDHLSAAQQLKRDWLAIRADAREAAQDVREAEEGARFELFKYFTKLTDSSGKMRASQLDTIFRAMHNRRVVQPFGWRQGELPSIHEAADESHETIHEGEEGSQAGDEPAEAVYVWYPDYCDWVDENTGEALCGLSTQGQKSQPREIYNS